MKSKTIQIIAGPNGSGKSTFADSYFLGKLKLKHFINSDTIATGLTPLDVEKAAFAAGRIMLAAVKDSIAKGESFAFETTLSGKTWLPILRRASEQGYRIMIYFIYVDRVQENIRRIKIRVANGGHFIPSETVRRRYPKTFLNFWRDYRPFCDSWYVFDNSKTRPKLIQSRSVFENLPQEEQEKFEQAFLKWRKK